MNIYNDVHSIIISIANELGIKDKAIIEKITSEPPKDRKYGDISTNLALIGSKALKEKSLDLAKKITEELLNHKFISKVEIAGPGFVNLYLDDSIWHKCCIQALKDSNNYGKSKLGFNKKINIEFVSANPTGPIHIGHTRGAVFGDSLANVLKFSGYDVTKEYYVNDAGEQVANLARSVYKRYLEILEGLKFEYGADLYPGEYLIPVAKKIINKYGKKFVGKDELDWIDLFKKISTDHLIDNIKSDLAKLGIKHDNFIYEQSLLNSGLIEKIVSILRKKNLIYEGELDPPKGKLKDTWKSRKQLLFKSTQFGDDVDRPLTKSDGSWTYFATDCAYHYEKYKRKFFTIINVWGADHGGYIKRIKGIIDVLSSNKVDFQVKLCQLVNVTEDGAKVKMSKREGNFISLASVIKSVGPDVIRFIMLTRKNDASLDFDIEKVTEQSNENPVYYVQYAHARIRSLHKKAMMEGFKEINYIKEADFSLLTDSCEINMMRLVATWPRIVELAAKSYEPHRITFFLSEIASEFHHLWSLGNSKPELRYIIPGNKKLTVARLSLAESVRIVISSGLLLIGVKPLEMLK